MDQGVWHPPGNNSARSFSTLCLDGTMYEWLTEIDEVNVPSAWAWADDEWAAMPLGELVCVFTYLTAARATPDGVLCRGWQLQVPTALIKYIRLLPRTRNAFDTIVT